MTIFLMLGKWYHDKPRGSGRPLPLCLYTPQGKEEITVPTKLKGLEVTKVDFVDAGDNKRADVVLFKRKDSDPAQSTPAQEPPKEGALKRMLTKIAKAVGLSDDEVDEAVSEIQKDATTFDEKVAQRQRRKTADEIWDFCWMLQDSLCSIFWDENLTDTEKQGKMSESLTEFSTAVQGAIPKWAGGTPSAIAKAATPTIAPERLEFAKQTRDRLDELIAKAENPNPDEEPETPPDDSKSKKGAHEDMKIDKSKLTPEELAALDAIEKKAGIPDDTAPAAQPSATEPPATEPTAKAAPATQEPAAGAEDDDIYKGLHPAVKAELERLRKAADAAEERELQEVAKKYEIIGKKAEELVPLLKSLKAAGGSAYDQMIAVLDASVEAVEKSGIFSEVGKRGGGGSTSGDAWAQIEKHAEAIQKSVPTMSWPEAVDKACEQHPELVHEYENGR